MNVDLEGKPRLHHVETAESQGSPDEIEPLPQKNVVGTVKLIVNKETVLIPTPSPDPKGTTSPRAGQ